jgi:hypothetical protein
MIPEGNPALGGSHTGVCEINALFDSGAYEIGQRFGVKRASAIPVPGLRVMSVSKAHKEKHRNEKERLLRRHRYACDASSQH